MADLVPCEGSGWKADKARTSVPCPLCEVPTDIDDGRLILHSRERSVLDRLVDEVRETIDQPPNRHGQEPRVVHLSAPEARALIDAADSREPRLPQEAP